MNNQGFTLIELVVAMMIIAVLSTAGISNYISSLKKGRDAQRKADLAQLQRSLEAYANDNKGAYPVSDASGNILGCPTDTAGVCDWGSGSFRDTNGAIYMNKLIKDPTTSQNYFYVSGGEGNYQIYSRLENSKDLCFTNSTDMCKSNGFVNTVCGQGLLCNYGVASTNSNP